MFLALNQRSARIRIGRNGAAGRSVLSPVGDSVPNKDKENALKAKHWVRYFQLYFVRCIEIHRMAITLTQFLARKGVGCDSGVLETF